jgi:hypothetical protein
MNLHAEIKQLIARDKEVVVGLADGTIVRGRFGGFAGHEDDLATFDAAEVVGPGKPFIRAGVLIALRNVCWIETA